MKQKLKDLSTDELKAQSGAISQTVAGVARKVQGADKKFAKVENIRAEKSSLMSDARDKSRRNNAKQENNNLTQAVADATSKGLMQFTFNGKTWYRKRKNSNSWYSD